MAETTTNINVALPRVIGTQDGVTYTVTGLPIGARYNQNRHRIEGLPAMDGTGMAILFAAREGIGAEVVITWTVTTPIILQFPNTRRYSRMGHSHRRNVPVAAYRDRAELD